MKKVILSVSLFFTAMLIANAQNVAINTIVAVADASSLLDVSSTTKGVLVPRVALTATNVAAPVTTPANSLLVYNIATAGAGTATGVSPGYYYWNATSNLWIRMLNTGDAWLTTGNYLGGGGAGLLGTLTADHVILVSGGASRGALVAGGELFLNPALAYWPGDVLSAYATGTQYGVSGYGSGTGASVSVYGENTSTGASMAGLFVNTSTNANSTNLYPQTTGAGWGIYSTTTNNANIFPAIAGVTSNLSETGVAGAVNAGGVITILVGGSGGAFVSPNTGVYANATNASSIGGLFAGNNVGAGSPAGGAGVAASGSGIGVYGSAATVASGSGGVFSGNNSGYSTLATGSGVAARGVNAGVFGIGGSGAAGTGGVFGGNNLATTALGTGSGVAAIGSTIGVFGISGNNNNAGGGYFQNATGSSYAYVGYRNAGTDFKIIGAGGVSTIVKDLNNKPVTMFCPESPEVLFQDFGEGQLINGSATIALDPIFSKNIQVDTEHPLRVIIQLEGDCNGVYVANKTANGFEVKELQNGQSNVKFTWFASGNRVDTKDSNGNVISLFQDLRFPDAPGQLETIQQEVIHGETIIHETKQLKKDEIKLDRKEQKKIQ